MPIRPDGGGGGGGGTGGGGGGGGVGPFIVINPQNTDMGIILLGTPSNPQPITAKCVGTSGDFGTVQSYVSDNPHLTVSTPLPINLAEGSQATLNLQVDASAPLGFTTAHITFTCVGAQVTNPVITVTFFIITGGVFPTPSQVLYGDQKVDGSYPVNIEFINTTGLVVHITAMSIIADPTMSEDYSGQFSVTPPSFPIIVPAFSPGGDDMLTWWMIADRTNFHAEGTLKCYNLLDADGMKFWRMKQSSGHPWDIHLYDSQYIYFWITENADETGGFNNPTAWKRSIRTNPAGLFPQGRPLFPRYFNTAGSPVTLLVDAPNPGIRTLACETDGEPQTQLGHAKGIMQPAASIAIGGDIGTVQCCIAQYFWGGINGSSVYNTREQYYLVKNQGVCKWDTSHWNGTTYVLDQTSVENLIVAGGAPTPICPCSATVAGWLGNQPTSTNLPNPAPQGIYNQSVLFIPSELGLKQALLQVTTDVVGQGTFTITLNGNSVLLIPIASLVNSSRGIVLGFDGTPLQSKMLDKTFNIDQDCTVVFNGSLWNSPGQEKTVQRILVYYENVGLCSQLTATLKIWRPDLNPPAFETITNTISIGDATADESERSAYFDLTATGEIMELTLTRKASTGPVSLISVIPQFADRGEKVEGV